MYYYYYYYCFMHVVVVVVFFPYEAHHTPCFGQVVVVMTVSVGMTLVSPLGAHRPSAPPQLFPVTSLEGRGGGHMAAALLRLETLTEEHE